MQDLTYTTMLTNEADELEMHLYDEEITSNDLINYMSNTFRSFSDAISIFLLNYTDYSGDITSNSERLEYIYSKYNEIGYSINPTNIKNWLIGKSPAYTTDSKEKMYALCFALKFDVSITKEFFRKVYFDRCFDCHNITEAIYYYSIKNKLSFTHARKLIEKSNDITANIISNKLSETILYTNIIQQKIDSFNSDNEILTYFKDNIESFNINRISAKKVFYELLDNIQGTKEDARLILSNPKCVKDCSNNRPIKALTIIEYYKYNTDNNPLLKVYSDEFMINQILDNRQHEQRIPKSIKLPLTLKSSFPNRHVINDIRLSFEGKKNLKNDALRKTLILLFFYKYWCEQALGINSVEADLQFSTFIAEINDCIMSCGFEPLYIGNPYDWIFIFSSKCEKPLDTFRDIYASLIYYEVE